MRTQVGIVGAGPAGLMLSRLLHLQGIESIVIENRSRDYIENRIRAGLIEHWAADLLRDVGVGDRMQREGMLHWGINVGINGDLHRIDFKALVNKRVTIYGQQPAGNELSIIDIASGTVKRTISLGQYTRPHGVVFIPGDETRVVVTSESTGNVVIVDIEGGTVEAAIPTVAQGSHMAAITADGKRVFTSNVTSGSVSEIDLAERKFVRAIPVAPKVEGIAVTPDGSLVFAGSNTDGTVSIIDTGTGTIVGTLKGFKLPYRLAISADGRTAIVCDPEGGAISAIDVATRAVAWKLDGLGSPRGVSIAPDAKTAFVTLADDPSVGLVDMTTHTLVRTIPVGASPDGVGYGPTP